MNEPVVFVTGTDTGIGKTWVTCKLAQTLYKGHQSIAIQKWVETGWDLESSDYSRYCQALPHLKNEPINDIVPYRLNLASSPHLAAERDGITLNIDTCLAATKRLKARYQQVIIEGAGGVMVPVSRDKTLRDWLVQAKIPVLVVIGNRLGAINHSMLTIQSLQEAKIPILGLIVNHLGPKDLILDDNSEWIRTISGLPILMTCDWRVDTE